VDEIDDNVEMYAAHKTDMRKGLKLLIEADSEWQLKLRSLKEQSPPEELEQFSFVLANTVDSVKDSAASARETLQSQLELAKEKKLNKVYSERTD
jgi:flagellar hook-basal body complex protein FliE